MVKRNFVLTKDLEVIGQGYQQLLQQSTESLY